LIVAERRSSCLQRPGDDARFDGGGNEDSSAVISDAAPAIGDPSPATVNEAGVFMQTALVA
jgi:hypothetical protein